MILTTWIPYLLLVATFDSAVQAKGVTAQPAAPVRKPVTNTNNNGNGLGPAPGPPPNEPLIRNAVVSSGNSGPGCPNYSVRREWRDLTIPQRQAFINAVRVLRTKPSYYRQQSRYHDFSYIHAYYVGTIHHVPNFFPWHREFLRQFEVELQMIDPSVSIPYWDSGHNSYNPLANTDIFSSGPTSFGTKGTGAQSCLTDGFCAYWQGRDGQCLNRAYNANGLRFTDNTNLAGTVFNAPNFDQFSRSIESAHDTVHDYIGGNPGRNYRPGDMYAVDRSTSDPLFYLHHSNVDRLWWSWQQNNPNVAYTYSYNARTSDILPGLYYNGRPVTVQTVLRSDGGAPYCVQYAHFSQGLPMTRYFLRAGLSAFNGLSEIKVNKGNKTVVKHTPKPVASDWITFNAKKLKKDRKKMEAHVRLNEKTLAQVAGQYQREMDAFFKHNPQSSFAEAFQYTIQNWKWKTVN
ncbi:hypothetical protein HDU77_004839 [Chytriomyces hyalinus]|nr:hypothetical protein HDU77_004839 [Chytriomyces hyalinus]